MEPYPFINPIIVSEQNRVIDGLYRTAVCEQINCKIEKIVIKNFDPINSVEEIRRIQAEQKNVLENCFVENNIDYKTQLIWSSSIDKMEKFIQFQTLFKSDVEYWENLVSVYQHSNNNYKLMTQIKKLFLAPRKYREHLMNKKERLYLRRLKSEVTIYRGMTFEEYKSHNYGISWTLNKNIAEKFAHEYMHNYDSVGKNKVVKELTIKKDQIVAYFGDREEEEIIYITE